MSRTLKGVITFTVIEVVILVVWGVILDLGKGLPLKTQIVAIAVLAVGLFFEHLVATNVGRERFRNLLDTSD